MRPRDLLPNLPHEGPPIPRFLTPGFSREEHEEKRKEVKTPHARLSPVTTEETIEYQNRELSKVLLALETHLAQGCKIAGKPCDCCSGRHPLELEKLSEEALSMTDNAIYQDIIEFAHEVDQKANVAALESGEYDDDYPLLSIRARDIRKQLAAYSDNTHTKAASALRMIKSGEIG